MSPPRTGRRASTLHQIKKPDALHGRHPDTCKKYTFLEPSVVHQQCTDHCQTPREKPVYPRRLHVEALEAGILPLVGVVQLEAIASRLLDRLPGPAPQALPPQAHWFGVRRAVGSSWWPRRPAWLSLRGLPAPHLGQCPRVRCQRPVSAWAMSACPVSGCRVFIGPGVSGVGVRVSPRPHSVSVVPEPVTSWSASVRRTATRPGPWVWPPCRTRE